jgi:Type I phosphodiesterase / nucleotide pyrophosphatase
VSRLVPALMAHTGLLRQGAAADGGEALPDWLPPEVAGSRQVVLLVLDGLGWEQLREREHLAANLSAMSGHAVRSVVPTTTATVLTSITTGLTPADHGVIGYRVRVSDREVMNVLRWRTASGDARELVPPADFQPFPAFRGAPVPVVTRAEFASTGFTAAHLGGANLHGWRVPSTLRVEIARLLRSGERLVYAYYDGLDKVAHEWGLGEHFSAELASADALVGDVASDLPVDGALVVTSDHGQVHVGDSTIDLDDGLMADVELLSGEGRFRWLHAKAGRAGEVASRAADLYGDVAWVHGRDEIVERGWFGGPLAAGVARRVGDVALVARAPVSFNDPSDSGEVRLVSRHGSLTAAEMLVPLLAASG